MAGGLYDQHPDLLERFMYIFEQQNAQREREEAERNRKQGGPTATMRGPRKPTH